jgi:hypothetical protein
MTIPEADPSPVLPIWRGRQGTIAIVVLGVLALISGCGLAVFAENYGVVPACRAYAQAHNWQYLSYDKKYQPGRTGAICQFRSDTGNIEDVLLSDVSIPTDLWVNFALSLEITVPAFLFLFAVIRTWLYKRTSATP